MISINIYKHIYSEEIQTFQREKVSVSEFIDKDKSYQIIINDKAFIYPNRKRFPKLNDGDIVSVKLIPANSAVQGGVGGGLGVGMMILGILMAVGVGVLTFGGALGVGISLAVSGAMLAASSIAGALVPKPSEKTKAAFEKGYGFSSAGNELGKGKPFPVIFGTRRITPPIVGNYYLHGGLQEIRTDVYGDVTRYTYENVLEGYLRDDPGGNGTFLFPNPPGEPYYNTIRHKYIEHDAYIRTDVTYKDVQYIYALLCLGYGNISVKDIRLGDTVIASNNAGVTNGIIPIDTNAIMGTIEIRQGSLPNLYNKRKSMDGTAAALENNGTDNIIKIERDIPSGATAATLEFEFTQGLYYWNAHQAACVPTHAKIAVELYENGNLYHSEIVDIEGNQNKLLRHSKTFALRNTDKRYKIVIYSTEKNTEHQRSKDGSGLTNLTTLTAIVYDFNEPVVNSNLASKMTFMAVQLKADENNSGTLNKVNMIASNSIPVFKNGNWNTRTATSNPAAIALDMLRGGYLARKAPDASIDFKEFETVYNWCETKGYKCNIIFEEQRTVIDSVNDVLAICQGAFILRGGLYSIAHDRIREVPLAILTPKNSSNFQIQINTDEVPDGIKINFYDEAANYEETESLVRLVGENGNNNILTANPLGITSFAMAQKYGRYLLSVRRNRPETLTLNVPFYHSFLPVGSRVLVSQPTVANIGYANGMILQADEVSGVIVIDEKIRDLGKSKKYGFKILMDIGVVETVAAETTGSPNMFRITSGDVKPEYAGKTYAFGEYELETLDCILMGKSSVSTPTYSASLVLMPYSKEIFDAIDAPLKEYNPSVSIPGKPMGDQVYIPPKTPSSGADLSFGVDADGSVTVGGSDLTSITDTTPPDLVTSFRAQAQSNGTVNLYWYKTKDNDKGAGLAGYRIYRAEEKTGIIAEVDEENKTVRIEPPIKNLDLEIVYNLAVTMDDKDGSIHVLHLTPTETEGWLKLAYGEVMPEFKEKPFSLRYNSYIHMNAGASDIEAKDTSAVINTSYYYGISAYDRNNNENAITWLFKPIKAQNVIPPQTPHNLTGKALKGEIRLAWVAPTNAGNITYYEIWKRSGLSNAHEWEVLGRSGTLSYIEAIGQVEAPEIMGWRYKVRAYNLYETYGQFDTENGSPVDLSEYGTYIRTPVTPQLTAVGDSINISWAKQYDLMDFKAWQIQVSRNAADWYSLDFKGENPTTIEKDTFTETVSPVIHGSLFLDKEAVETDGETQYVPIPTLYKYRMRQVSESGDALDWSDENTPIAEVYAEPIDILKLNVGNLSVNDGKFLSMRGGSMLGFAKDDNLPESQRISAEDTTLNYLDLTNNKMRFGTLNSFMLVDYVKGLVAFKGTELQLDQSSLTTNADGIDLKHEGRALTWEDSEFGIEQGKITGNADGININATNITQEAKNIKILGTSKIEMKADGIALRAKTANLTADEITLDAKTTKSTGDINALNIKGTSVSSSSRVLAGNGASGGYSFVNDGAFDTGMFSNSDGDLYFLKNNVRQDISSLLDGVLEPGKGGVRTIIPNARQQWIFAGSVIMQVFEVSLILRNHSLHNLTFPLAFPSQCTGVFLNQPHWGVEANDFIWRVAGIYRTYFQLFQRAVSGTYGETRNATASVIAIGY